MSDWLAGAMAGNGVPAADLAVRLAAAAAAGVAVAAIYRVARRPGPDSGPLTETLVLLSVLIALVTVAIGDNLARAFGLVGALSIVRFRTVVDDTRDTAFVIFAVAAGMVVGAGYLPQAAVGVAAVGLTAVLVAVRGRATAAAGREGVLHVRLAADADPEKLSPELAAPSLSSARLVAAGTAKQGASIDLTYAVRWKGDLPVAAVVAAVGRCEGVQGVEFRPGRG